MAITVTNQLFSPPVFDTELVAGSNLMREPGQEQFSTTSQNGSSTVTRDNTQAHSGSWSIKCVTSGAISDGTFSWVTSMSSGDNRRFKPGTTFLIETWVLGTAGDLIAAQIRDQDISGNGGTSTNQQPTVTMTGSWQKLSYVYTTTRHCLIALKVVTPGTAIITFWQDDNNCVILPTTGYTSDSAIRPVQFLPDPGAGIVSQVGGAYQGTGTAFITIALTAAVPAGDTVIANVGYVSGTASITGVTDSKGNTYRFGANSQRNATSWTGTATAFVTTALAAGDVITFALSGSPSQRCGMAHRAAKVQDAAWLATGGSGGTATALAQSCPLSIAGSGGALLVGAWYDNGGTPTAVTPTIPGAAVYQLSGTGAAGFFVITYLAIGDGDFDVAGVETGGTSSTKRVGGAALPVLMVTV